MEIRTAQKKLKEVRFFLRHLQREERQAVRADPEAFTFFLSALLNAAVSIRFVLEHENGEKFNHWYKKWRQGLLLEEKQLWKRMWKEREAEVKKRGAHIVAGARTMAPEFVEGFYIVAPLAPGLPLATGGWVYVDEHHFESGEERVRAVDFFERLLRLLDRLVSEVPKS